MNFLLSTSVNRVLNQKGEAQPGLLGKKLDKFVNWRLSTYSVSGLVVRKHVFLPTRSSKPNGQIKHLNILITIIQTRVEKFVFTETQNSVEDSN